MAGGGSAGNKRQSVKSKPVTGAPSRNGAGEFSLELRQGEVDKANTKYLMAVEEALLSLENCEVFKDLVQCEPRGISDLATDSGFQAVFDQEMYAKAIATGTYTAGGNLFWLDFRWSATPGVPLRLEAVKDLASLLFAEPTPYPGALHVAVTADFVPLNHKGSWKSMSPEEIAHAMLFAVSDAVKNESGNLEFLNNWKRCMLSTTFTFKLLPNAEARTWYALQQRENVSIKHMVVNRSCFQRCHEVLRLRQRLMESNADVTAAMIHKVYQDNLKMVNGSSGQVTLGFCDVAATIVNKLIEVAEINTVLMEADSMQGRTQMFNVFDSHSRLQAIVNKAGSNVEHRIWIVQGLWYMSDRGRFDKEVSVADLKGSPKSSNKGLCDLLVYKYAMKQQLFQRETPLRANDILINVEVPFPKWVENEVDPRMKTFHAWSQNEKAQKHAWRAGRPASEVRWLNFVEDVVFGTLWDGQLKVLVKNGTSTADAIHQGLLAEELSAIDVQHREEQEAAGKTAGPQQETPATDDGDKPVDLVVDSVMPDGTRGRTDIRLSAMTDDRREIVESALQRTRKTIAANIVLINKNHPDGVAAQVAKTPLGQLQGTIDLTTPARSKHVAIIYDVKCSGEATHRPNLRIPPLQQRGDHTIKPLVDMAMKRMAPRLPDGEPAPEGSLDAGDIYFLMDGGMSGNVNTLFKVFQGKEKATKTFFVTKDLKSLDARHERVRGVANIRQTETMIALTQSAMILPPVDYQTYNGGSYGDLIGPVILTPAEEQWRATWAEKKKIFGPEQLIDVGGKLEADAPEPKRKKQRTDDTIEPVFFHSMPVTFWSEILAAFNIVGVIDLCAGEGTCAQACFRKNIPYVGITFNEHHSNGLLAHLEKVFLSAMTTDGDTLYNVKFAEAVRDTQPKNRKGGGKNPPPPKNPKKDPKKDPKANPKDDEEEDGVGNEPGLSGDE